MLVITDAVARRFADSLTEREYSPATISKYAHNLRHLFARTHYAKFKDIVRLADILGHSSIDTTRIYTARSGKEERRQLGQLRHGRFAVAAGADKGGFAHGGTSEHESSSPGRDASGCSTSILYIRRWGQFGKIIKTPESTWGACLPVVPMVPPAVRIS